jgi:hypothetical protein
VAAALTAMVAVVIIMEGAQLIAPKTPMRFVPSLRQTLHTLLNIAVPLLRLHRLHLPTPQIVVGAAAVVSGRDAVIDW